MRIRHILESLPDLYLNYRVTNADLQRLCIKQGYAFYMPKWDTPFKIADFFDFLVT